MDQHKLLSQQNLFAYNPTAKTAILLFAEDGQKYWLDAQKFEELDLKGKESHTFQMKNVTYEVNNVQGLRALIGS